MRQRYCSLIRSKLAHAIANACCQPAYSHDCSESRCDRAGGSLHATVTASNASQVAISDNTDSSTYTLAAAGGTQKVTPGATTTYTATATGTGGTATAQTVITVAPLPTVTITANPTTIAQGSASTLTITANNTTQAVISDNVDSNNILLLEPARRV